MELMAFKRMHDDGILNFEREKKLHLLAWT